ncbi:MAG: hypothetical protein AB1505_17310 [Candidatus Latescibacterota bacterium]
MTGRLLIGVDDTDDADSRGTGFRARQLGELLERQGLAAVGGISRHQLLVSPEIPYTSHNSSACLVAEAPGDAGEALVDACRRFLLAESAPGADAGLCVAAWDGVDAAIVDYGVRAKQTMLAAAEASTLSQERGIRLEGLTGTGGGVIGALAAVGLRRAGNDGRCLWLPGLRELAGVHRAADLLASTGIEAVEDQGGTSVPPTAHIDVGSWARPVLRAGRAVLLVEEVSTDEHCEWRVLDREHLKRLSE